LDSGLVEIGSVEVDLPVIQPAEPSSGMHAEEDILHIRLWQAPLIRPFVTVEEFDGEYSIRGCNRARVRSYPVLRISRGLIA
jgi:hypothetical protein